MLLQIITNKNICDAGFTKFVDFFQNDENYYMVTEHGGDDLLSYIQKNHPSNFNDENIDKVDSWKNEIRYYFRIIVRCMYYLHIECNMAHLDLSLQNIVIDKNNNDNNNNGKNDQCSSDPFVRITNFGSAKQNPNGNNNDIDSDSGSSVTSKDSCNGSNKWLYYGYNGKIAYQCPEIRTFINDIQSMIDENNENNNIENNGNISDNISDVSSIANILYNPFSADIWSLGVILFIMLTNGQPWHIAESRDTIFNLIMNGQLQYVLKLWESQQYVDTDAFDLLTRIFVCENDRISIKDILNHKYVTDAPRTLQKE